MRVLLSIFGLLLISLTFATAQEQSESLDLDTRIGVSLLSSQSYSSIFNTNSYTKKYGNAIEIGGYFERKIRDRVLLSRGLYLAYKKYPRNYAHGFFYGGVIDTIDVTYHYKSDMHRFKVAIPFEYRFFIFKNPKIYGLLGIGLQFYFYHAFDTTYLRTTYQDIDENIIGESTVNDREISDPSPNDRFSVNLDIGLGYQWNKIALELILSRIDYVDSISIGLRLRKQLATKAYK